MTDRGFAGASAYREHARRRRQRDASIADAPESIQQVLRDASRRARDIAAWRTGALGESIVGRALDDCDERGIRLLHDRRVPNGLGNIDHLAIGPAGVFVVHAKNYRGRPRYETVGSGDGESRRLFVGRDDASELLAGVQRQVRIVATVLADPVVAVRGVLCFVGADWELGNGFVVDGVGVTAPDRLADLVTLPGPLDAGRIRAVHAHLEASLSAA